MNRLFRFAKGYVIVQISGFAPERFLNLSKQNHITIWNIVPMGNGYRCNVKRQDFFRMKSIVKKSRVKVVLLEKRGLPFWLQKNRKDFFYEFGFLLTVLLLYLSTQFIWQIHTEGNYQISCVELQNFFKDLEISIGTPVSNINEDILEKQLRKQFSEITWVCVKRNGSELCISVKENDFSEKEYISAEEQGYHIASDVEGTVVDMIVRQGIPVVKKGDVVSAGQILVEGVIPTYQEDGTIRNAYTVEADADIYVETKLHYSDELSMYYLKKHYTGRERGKIMLFMEKNRIFTLPAAKHYRQEDSLTEEKTIFLFQRVPTGVTLFTEKHREYVIQEYKYTKEEAENLLYEKWERFLKTLEEKGYKNIQKNVKIDTMGKNMQLYGELTVWKKIDYKIAVETLP